MGRKTKTALMALATVGILGAVTVSGFGVKSAFAEDDRAHPVASRVAEILGVEEDKVFDAFEQAHDEMPEHLRRGDMKMKRAQMGLRDISECLDVDLDELTQEFRDGDSNNLEGALVALGYDDIDTAKACVKEAMVERINENHVDDDRATEMLENVDDKIDFLFSHAPGEKPEFEMQDGMRMKGMHRDL